MENAKWRAPYRSSLRPQPGKNEHSSCGTTPRGKSSSYWKKCLVSCRFVLAQRKKVYLRQPYDEIAKDYKRGNKKGENSDKRRMSLEWTKGLEHKTRMS